MEELTLEGITVCKGRGNSRYRHSKKIINHMASDLEGYDKVTKSFTMFVSMRKIFASILKLESKILRLAKQLYNFIRFSADFFFASGTKFSFRSRAAKFREKQL